MSENTLELTVDSLSHDGRGVCRDGQRVVFVRGALPGERVRLLLTQEKKRFAEGHCLEVLEPAADAVPAPCPHAGECGGCPLQTMPYDRQLYWKGHVLADALARIAKTPVQPEAVAPSPKVWGYRNKMEFAFAPGTAGAVGAAEVPPVLGLRSGGTHEVVDITQCMLLPRGGMEALALVRELVAESGLPAWDADTGEGLWRHIVLRMPEAPGADGQRQLLVCCITAAASMEARAAIASMGDKLLQSDCGISGFVHEERHASSPVAQGEKTILRLGRTQLQEKLHGITYEVDHGGFFQVNSSAAELLCATVVAMAKPEPEQKIWDLYCGVGAPGLALASRESSVRLRGVEYHAGAVNMAKRNAAAAGFEGCTYVTGDARRVIKGWSKPHMVLADPPRAGLHADVVQAIIAAGAEKIVYVSCNPATLARDVALLAPHYDLRRVAAMDLFPHTAHVESVALLERRKK